VSSVRPLFPQASLLGSNSLPGPGEVSRPGEPHSPNPVTSPHLATTTSGNPALDLSRDSSQSILTRTCCRPGSLWGTPQLTARSGIPGLHSPNARSPPRPPRVPANPSAPNAALVKTGLGLCSFPSLSGVVRLVGRGRPRDPRRRASALRAPGLLPGARPPQQVDPEVPPPQQSESSAPH